MQKRNSCSYITWMDDWHVTSRLTFSDMKEKNNSNEVGIFNDAYFDVIGNTDADR